MKKTNIKIFLKEERHETASKDVTKLGQKPIKCCITEWTKSADKTMHYRERQGQTLPIITGKDKSSCGWRHDGIIYQSTWGICKQLQLSPVTRSWSDHMIESQVNSVALEAGSSKTKNKA